VSCKRPHTAETVFSFPVDGRPDPSDADQYYPLCFDKARLYIDVSPEHWVPWFALLWGPSPRDVARGAAWLRCDVGFPSDFPERDLTPVTGHVEGVVTSHPLTHWACLEQSPSWGRSQPLVSCRAPHRYEETGQIVAILSSTFPTAAVRERTATRCESTLRARPARRSTTFVQWGTRAHWRENRDSGEGELDGICWLHRSDGGSLPPIP
jgi:hypothetical protein